MLGGFGIETGGCGAGGFNAGGLNDRGAGTSSFGDALGGTTGLVRGTGSTFGNGALGRVFGSTVFGPTTVCGTSSMATRGAAIRVPAPGRAARSASVVARRAATSRLEAAACWNWRRAGSDTDWRLRPPVRATLFSEDTIVT